MSEDKRSGGGTSTGIIVKSKPKTKKPSMYKVLMLNDDYTPMEFVVHVLEHFFSKNREEATRIMLHVHQRGVGVRSEEHTSELQSLMRISYAVFCLKKKTNSILHNAYYQNKHSQSHHTIDLYSQFI